MPAPLANKNNVKHGLRMTVSALPSGCHYISQACYQLRRYLEEWCLDRRGKVGLWEAVCIQSAIRYEQVSHLCARWLREANGSLTAAEKLGYARQIAEASDKRDKVLQRLGIDKSEERDIFDLLYAKPPTPLDYQPGGNGTQAAQHSVGATESDGNGQHVDQAGDATAASTASEGGHTA